MFDSRMTVLTLRWWSGFASMSAVALLGETFRSVVDSAEAREVSSLCQTVTSPPEIDCGRPDFQARVVERNERHRRRCHSPPSGDYYYSEQWQSESIAGWETIPKRGETQTPPEGTVRMTLVT